MFKPNPHLDAVTREANRRRGAAWREKHRERERVRAREAQRIKRLDPVYREQNKKYQKENYWKNPEIKKAEQRRRNRMLRISVLTHYGGKCGCCGEMRMEFLALDHINGDGRSQRQKHGAGIGFYNYVKKHWPTDLRILCHNCNQAIGLYGYCPHKMIVNIETGVPIILNPTGG